MYSRYLFLVPVSMFAMAATLSAQNFQRRAEIRGGDPGRGKCTIEVVVDGAAEVEIRGDSGVIRNLAGQPPQWRRFVCNTPMPANPGGFRFAGVDGRGRQTLVRAPGGGSPAVIRIDDPDNGSEGYTFDLFWGEGGDVSGPGRPPYPGPGNRPPYGADEAIRGCQDAIRQQARDQFRGGQVEFRRVNIDDNPGRRDWVIGSFDLRRGFDRDRVETFRFSCSVDFNSGRIRSAQIEPAGGGNGRGGDGRGGYPGGGGGGGNFSPTDRAIRNCQRGVEERLGQDGFSRVDFDRINVDDRPGRRDSVVGSARATLQNGARFFDFSCSVNLDNGEIRSVDVRRR